MVWGIVSAVAVFIILAIAAAKVEHGWKRAEDSLRRGLSRRRQSRDLKQRDVRKIASRHAADFEERGLIGELFTPSTVHGASPTPILVNDRSLTIRSIEFQGDAFLSIGNTRRVDYAVDEHLVKATLASGRRLTDDSVLYLDKATSIGDEYSHINVGITGYRIISLHNRFQQARVVRSDTKVTLAVNEAIMGELKERERSHLAESDYMKSTVHHAGEALKEITNVEIRFGD